jgi:adenosylhomocysteine nucleosidase
MPSSEPKPVNIVVVIAADAEWRVTLDFFNPPRVQTSPFGEFFVLTVGTHEVLLFQCSWGKVAAAAGTQYAIDRWHPEFILNIGTCGGFAGEIEKGEIILARETIIYDIHERMGDPRPALDHYHKIIDHDYLCMPLPQKVRIARLVSADQDIDPAQIPSLRDEYHAVAADWESGAIVWTAKRNATRVLVLRAVSDLVSQEEGEIYDSDKFADAAREAMLPMLKALPNWVRCIYWGQTP